MTYRWAIPAILCAAAIVAGCGNEVAPNDAAAPKATASEAPRPPVRETLSGLEAAVSGMDLYMHDIEPTGDSRRKPTLWVHAAEGQLKPDNSWALADARAVIYREQEEDILLESKTGRFDEGQKVAVLEGGVSVAAGEMRFSTDSVSYDNEQRIVQTHAPVVLSDGKTQLNADHATLEPDDGVVILSNVSGTLSLDRGFE